jgi:hypothetical protein
MSRSARLATSLLAVAAILAIGAFVAAGATDGPPATVTSACGAATDSAYDSTALAAVLRIARGERAGGAVHRAVRMIETNAALLRAVSARNRAATRPPGGCLPTSADPTSSLRCRGRFASAGGWSAASPCRCRTTSATSS